MRPPSLVHMEGRPPDLVAMHSPSPPSQEEGRREASRMTVKNPATGCRPSLAPSESRAKAPAKWLRLNLTGDNSFAALAAGNPRRKRRDPRAHA